MLKIRSVSLKNFMSVGQVTQAVDLTRDGMTLVLGNNMDTAMQGENAARNGAGKSTLLNAISYGLFGQALSKIKKDNLINKTNQKAMAVTVEFEIDGVLHRIERGRKPTFFRYFVNDQKIGGETDTTDESQGEGKHTQESIEDALGFSHTMFCHFIALNTYTEPFLKMGAAKQREVIEELLGITLLSQKADALREQIKETKALVTQQEFEVKTLADQNTRIERAIEDAKLKQRTWNDRHQRKLAELQETLAGLGGIDFDAELAQLDAADEYRKKVAELEEFQASLDQQLQAARTEHRVSLQEADALTREAGLVRREKKDATKEAALVRRDIQVVDDTQLKRRLDSDIARYRGEIGAFDEQIADLTKERDRLDADLASPDALLCKTCNQALGNTDHKDYVVKRMTADRDSLTARIDRATQNRTDRLAQIQGLEGEKEQIDRRKQEAEVRNAEIEAKAVARMQEIETANVTLEAEAQGLDDKAAGLREAAEAQRGETDRVLREAREQIAAEKAALGDCPEPIFQNRDDLWLARSTFDQVTKEFETETAQVNPYDEQVKTWTDSLVDIDYTKLNGLVRTKEHQEFLLKMLADKSSFIRKSIIDQNLSYLNSRLSHHLGRIGLPHEVKFQNDLTVEITQFGRDLDFDNLSRGEQNRLILSLSWAFRDIFESMKQPVNLMIVDELADSGMDGLGVELTFESLKAMARERGKNVLLVSHRDELLTRCGSILMARKENGFTVYETESVAA